MLPARQIAIVIWVVAAAVFILQQIAQPILEKDFLNSAAGLLPMLDRLANAIIYPGGIAAFGAIVHLLGEIRDASVKRRERNP
jgi:hypothetical protein